MIKENITVRLPIEQGDFQLKLFRDPSDNKEHIALIHGDISSGSNILVRIHSECLTGDVFGSLRCDCGAQLQNALQQIVANGSGVLLYLRQEGRGIGLFEKLKAYDLQERGHDTVEANILLGHQADERNYTIAADMLRSLGITSVRLITNNPDKMQSLSANNIEVVERVRSPLAMNKENASYLKAKAQKLRHIFNADEEVCLAD